MQCSLRGDGSILPVVCLLNNVLWCHLHLVCLVFEGSIPTCTCFHSENFFVTCLYRKVVGVRAGWQEKLPHTQCMVRIQICNNAATVSRKLLCHVGTTHTICACACTHVACAPSYNWLQSPIKVCNI